MIRFQGMQMGLSIFYSLSLPTTLNAAEVEAKLVVLASKAQTSARGTGVKIGAVKKLSASDCGMAQATMNEDFDFARCVCQPPGASRSSPLGEVPEIAFYFRMSSRDQVGICVGLAMYKSGAKFRMVSGDGESESPYDGRWYFWTFIDEFSDEEARLLESLLREATGLGFETTFRDERR